MINRIKQELIAEKLAQLEFSANETPDNTFLYRIKLRSGGNLEAFEITIGPDEIMLVSVSGLQTTIPLDAISSIGRVKLPTTVE